MMNLVGMCCLPRNRATQCSRVESRLWWNNVAKSAPLAR